MRLKLISWNVNGVRAVQRNNGFSFLAKEKPDILCLQETRAGPRHAEGFFPRLKHQEWSAAERPGYSGTAVCSRLAPLSIRTGIGVREHDGEGRVVVFELEKLFVLSVYTPNSGRDLRRLPYRTRWDRAFLRFLRTLQSEKPVLFCGDINVAHQEIDLARARENRGANGFTDVERAGFSAILRSGFADTFRELHPDQPAYTWWNVATASRARNVGWRIDYVVISQSLRPALRKAFILPEVTGSDHCPVGVVLEL